MELEQQQPAEGSEFCAMGKHYIRDSSANKFVEVGPCEDPKHQVVNAAEQARQAAAGEDQSGAAMQGADQGSKLIPSKAINKLLGVGDDKAVF